ncbi:MAG: hypothetical protein PHT13_00350 [Methanosarcina sp.]|jgi:hypothetical protein|nr:hypothetical protein [Methanosarcina sp.]
MITGHDVGLQIETDEGAVFIPKTLYDDVKTKMSNGQPFRSLFLSFVIDAPANSVTINDGTDTVVVELSELALWFE